MNKLKKKILIFAGTALIIAFSACATGFAEEAGTIVQAQFKNLKIIFNGQQVPNDTQPVIINGSTYLPLRKLATLFDKNISWDAATQQITISDNSNSEIESLKAQIAEKDIQIQLLQIQLANATPTDIWDLEDQLNDDYGDYRDMEWDITLDGDEDDVEVEIEIDLDDYDRDWDRLSTSKKERLIEDICDDILAEYEDAEISGTVSDSSRSSSNELMSFTVNSRGKLTIEETSDLSDLEDDLNDEYYDYLEDDDIDDLTIELDGDEDDITFTINIDCDDYQDEWDDLSNSTIITLMSHIRNDIEDEFDDADIEGYVYDTDSEENLARFSDSKSFTRY